jgi:hypothetical protein
VEIEETASENMPEEALNGCHAEAAELMRMLTRKERSHPSIEVVFPSVELCWEMAAVVTRRMRDT